GTVHYSDDFGDCREGCTRHHMGNDLLGAKLVHEVAASDGTIAWVHADNTGTAGNMLQLTGNDGWVYWYIHINNDTPGTDDGKNPKRWILAPGIHAGSKVKAGQFISYMADSGDAESTQPHLHFEIHMPNGTVIDPYTSLLLAQGLPARQRPPVRLDPRHAPQRARHGDGADPDRTRLLAVGEGRWRVHVRRRQVLRLDRFDEAQRADHRHGRGRGRAPLLVARPRRRHVLIRRCELLRLAARLGLVPGYRSGGRVHEHPHRRRLLGGAGRRTRRRVRRREALRRRAEGCPARRVRRGSMTTRLRPPALYRPRDLRRPTGP